MSNFKLIKTAAALALGASVVTSAVVPADASAASKYKVKNGKLVIAKTGKKATGTVTFNKIVYKNGVKLTGLKGKVYYKAGKKATGTYKGAYYVSGAKKVTTGTYNKAYYVKGVKKVTTGLYASKYYKSGKLATATYKGAYYVNGVKKVTTGTYNKAYYVAGKKVVSTGTYNKAYYVNGVKKIETGLLDGVYYVDGAKATGTFEKAYYVDGAKKVETGLFEDKFYFEGALNVGSKLFDGKLYKDVALNSGLVAFEDKVYNGAILAEGTFEYEGKEEAFEAGVKVGAKVSSVTAINGTTVEVKFNKAVDEESATATATSSGLSEVVTIDDADLTSPVLSKDGRTLTLKYEYVGGATEFEDATVIVLPVVTKADEKVSTAKFVSVLNYEDTVAPTVVSASSELASINSAIADDVTVKFSEDVQASGIFYVNGTAVSIKSGTRTNFDELTLDISSLKLKAGAALEVKMTNVKDIAGNNISPNPATITTTIVAANTVAPKIVSATNEDDNKVVVTFDKEVVEPTLGLTNTPYLSVAGNKIVDATLVEISDDKKSLTYTFVTTALTFDATTKKSTATMFIPKEAVADAKANLLASEYSSSVTFEKDAVKPTVTSTTVKNGSFVFEFSEKVELQTGYVVNYATTNATTGYVNTTTAPLNATTATFKLSADGKTLTVTPKVTTVIADGSYQVSFAADFVKDTSNATNGNLAYKTTVDYKSTAVSTDKTAPTFAIDVTSGVATVVTDTTNKVYQVTYKVKDVENKLDFSSIQDKNNYTLDGKALPAGTTITTNSAAGTEVNTDVTVTLSIPFASVDKTITAKPLTITGIKDVVGNTSNVIETAIVSLDDKVAPKVVSATAYKADNKILVTLSEDITDVTKLDEADFLVSVNGATATAVVASIAKATGADAGVGNYVLTLVSSTLDATTTTKVELTTVATASIASTDDANNPLTAVTTPIVAVIK